MNPYIRKFIYGRSRRSSLTFIGCIFVFAWITGLFDHSFETTFKEFTWPSSSNDIFGDIHKLITGEKVSVPVMNNYAKMPILHSPRCKGQKFDLAYNLLIVVKSAVDDIKSRNIIRETWGKEHVIDDFNVRTVFVIGKFSTEKEHKSMKSALEREAQIHKDMIIGDFIDSYRNNTLKLIYSLRYAYKPGDGCPTPDFTLLIDDDYMLSTHNLIRLLDTKSSQEPLYEGWRFDTTPFRFKLHKHAVELADYPYDRYPPYISAGCVLLSRTTVDMFYHAAQLLKVYPFDDVYAGIMAHFLRIHPTHNDGFIFWSREVSHEEWLDGKTIAAHGYDSVKLEKEYPLVRFAIPGK